MEFVRSLLWEKINVRIDCSTSQGGTISTGNVVRTCFQPLNDDNKDFLYLILTLIPCKYHQLLTVISNNLAVVLRIFNSDERVDNEKFATLCTDIGVGNGSAGPSGLRGRPNLFRGRYIHGINKYYTHNSLT